MRSSNRSRFRNSKRNCKIRSRIIEPIPLSELEAELQNPEPDYEIVEPIPLSELEADLRMPERWKVPDVPTPTKKEWERLRESFIGEDRLAFIEDPSIREELRGTLSNFLNPEEEEKRFALAAYFSNMQLKNLKFCYNNLDELIAKYDINRSAQTVEQAYNDIAATFNPQLLQERNIVQRGVAAVFAAEGEIAKITYDTAGFLSRLWAEANTTYAKAELLGRGQDEAAAMIRDPQEAGALVEETVRGVYKKYYAETAEHYTQEMQLPENWMTNSDSVGDWVGNAAVATVYYIPQLAAQSGITVATGGVSALAFIYGVNGYYDIRDNYPEMSEEEAVAYGVGVALINGMLEKVTLGIIDGKVSKKVAEEGIRKGLLQAAKHFGWNMTKEGAAEGMEEFSQNILDISMGLRGDVSQWSGEDYRRELFRNVPESSFIGGISASPFAANSYRNYREIAARHETERAMIRDEIARLESQKELSESEEVALARLHKLDDAGSIADVEQAARAVAEDSFIRKNANAEVSPEERAIESEAWEGATEEEIRNAAEAERNFRNFSRLPHNPQDTVDAVREVARQFPDVTFQVVRNENEFPPEIREELRRRFGKTRAASAFYYNDEVWINAGKLKPSQVEAKILHEVVGHKGLRMLFPNDRSFDAILDNIYREHFNEPGFDRVAQLNFPFHERIFETDVETGEESGSGRVNLETAEDQRIAAEEYVASIAESGAPKPNWWKEFLQSVRMWIADRFPHARQVRMTDREIETLLARSARAARRNRRGEGKVIAPESMIRFRVNKNGETIFGIAGRDGDFTAREIMEDKTISENTPILTSEGSEVWGEITPEMAEAGKELGLEALPIKLLKGKHFGNHAGFGLAHLWNQHGAELEARGYDLSDFLTGIFGKPSQIYASKQGDNIRLELVTKSMPRNLGVWELRKEKGFYSVVTAFPIEKDSHQFRGNKIWTYEGSAHTKSKQRTQSLEPLSGDQRLQPPLEDRGIQTNDNITSSGEKSSGNTGAVYSVDSVWTGSAASYDAPVQPIHIPDVGIDFSNTRAAREFLRSHFQGMELQIKSDGRLVLITGSGIKSGLKKRGVHREAFPALDRIITEAYPAGYRTADEEQKHSHLNGQYLYASLVEINGEMFAARILLDDDRADHRAHFKDITLQKIEGASPRPDAESEPEEKAPRIGDGIPSAALAADAVEVGPPETSPSPAVNIKQLIELVNPELNRNPENSDLRFAISEFSADEESDIIALLRPFVGVYMSKSDAEIVDYLRRHGVELSEEEAHAFHKLASAENMKRAREISRAARDKWLLENVPEYSFMVDQYGNDFRIDPGPAYSGEAFTGTFIAGKGKNKGTPIGEIARKWARKFDVDENDAEKHLIEFFRNLKKPDLYRLYSDWKKEQHAFSRRQEAKMFEEWEKLQFEIAEEQIVDLASSGEGISSSWISAHRKAYELLYRRLFDRKPPKIPGKADLEKINAALNAQGDKAETIARTWKEARKTFSELYQKKLNDLWETMRRRHVDMRKLQNQAKEFAFEHLDPETRSKFLNRILRIADYKTEPTTLHPEGRRNEEFARLMADMGAEFETQRRNNAISEIRAMINANRSRRTRKNVPFSPMGERQRALDRIGQIVRMDPETVNANLAHLLAEKSNAVEEAESLPEIPMAESSPERKKLEAKLRKIDREIFYFNHFGALSLKKSDAVVNSMKLLRKFIRDGRMEFKENSDREHMRFKLERENLRREMGKGNLDVPGDNELDRTVSTVADFFWKSESINRMLDVFSRSDDLLALDDSAHGKIINQICDSTQKEQTGLNSMQKWFDSALKEYGVKNIVEKGKFLNESMRIEETGIPITQYFIIRPTVRSAIESSGETYSDRASGRPKITAEAPVEHVRKMLEDGENGRETPIYYQLDGIETWKNVRADLKANKLRTGRSFSIFGDAAGNLRVYTENDAGETVGFSISMQRMPALEQAVSDGAAKPFPVDDFTRSAAREMIFEYDAGGGREAMQKGFGDDIDDAAQEAFLEKGGSHSKIELIAPDPEAKSRQTTLKLSPGAAMQLILEWEQKQYRNVMEWNGYSEETIRQLKAWLDRKNPAYLKMAYAMREYLAEQRPELDRAVFQRYGVHLPDTENFFYADFSGSVADNVRDPGFGNPAGGMTVSANFLTARRFHLLPPSTNTNAITLFLFKQLEQNHFIAWNQTIRELRALYSDRDVQNSIVANFGQDAWNNLREKIELIAANGRRPDAADKFYRGFFKTWTPSQVAINITSIMKQAAGGVSYANYIPTADLFRYLPEANWANKSYREWAAYVLKNDPYLANRRAGGLDPNLAGTLNFTRRRGKISPISDEIMRKMLFLNLSADQITAITWGYAAFRSFQVRSIKNGKSRKEAFDAAMRLWKRATDETQQSGYLKDMNHFTASPGLWRYLTTFRTNPMQVAALEIDAIRKVLLDPKNKNNWKTLARRAFVNHILTTTLMNLCSSFVRHGFDFADYLDDIDDYIAGWVFGSFDSIWLFGQGATMIVRGMAGDPFAAEMSAVPLLSDLARDASLIRRTARDGFDEERILDYVKATGDILMSAGPAQTRTIGMLIYSFARQGKRVAKWFSGE